MRVTKCEHCHEAEPIVWWLADTEDGDEDYVLCLDYWARIESERPGASADVVTYTEVMR